jgi:transposase-like protein
LRGLEYEYGCDLVLSEIAVTACGAKFPDAAAKITGDMDELPAFCGYPAEHRVHLRTANPIEPAFATVRHRTKVTKGPAP